MSGKDAPDLNGYEIFDIDAAVIQALVKAPRRSLERTFGNRAPAPQQIVRPGDVLQISIWEASSGGLFSGVSSATGSRAENLPPVTVDTSGKIIVPFAGQLQVAGKTTAEVGQLVQKRLQGMAIEPQVLVNINQSGGSSATVTGDVTGAARVPLNPKGDRLLEVIAQGGGIKAPPHETFVRVTRGGQTSAVSMATILERPSENIYVHPGDLIYVFRQPQSFTSLGAVTKQGELPIDRQGFTLAQAVGLTGGLNDLVADSRGVFLFRYEQPEVVRALRPTSPLLAGAATVPVIYRLQFSSPSGYFLAKSFEVASQDVVYVANAPAVEFMKFVMIVKNVASTARSIQQADPNVIN